MCVRKKLALTPRVYSEVSSIEFNDDYSAVCRPCVEFYSGAHRFGDKWIHLGII